MLNKEILKNIKWLKEDENQRLIYLPPFYNIYKLLNEKLISKIELEGFNPIYIDKDYQINEEEYMYYFSNFKKVDLRYRNSNLDLAKHKTLDILALFERFINEQLALPCLSGKTLNKELTEFINLVYINGKYFEAGNIKYQNGSIHAIFNFNIIDILLSNHMDEYGFILPPMVSPIQVCFLMEQKPFAKDIKFVNEHIHILKQNGINASLDESSLSMKEKIDSKFKEGIPLLIEVYHKNIEKDRYTLINRLTSEKIKISINELSLVKLMLRDIQNMMYKKSLKRYIENDATSIPCCMNEECINKLKENEYEIIIPFMQAQNSGNCLACGNKNKKNIKKYKKF